jgi:site-specific recombinase XerD
LPINDNLEAMAKQLYDYWFVQFDFPNEEGKPYKSNGGVMVWNEKLKREIPQGWSDCVLGDYIGRITNGLNPRKNFVLGSGNNYYVTIRSLVGTTIDWNNCDRCDDEALSKINSRSQLQIGDIIFSAIGTIGRTYYILEEPTNWNISETSFTLRAKENIPNDFFYGMLRSNEIQIKADKAAMGSTLRCLVMDSLCSLQYIEIPSYMMKLFATKVSPLYRQIHRNNKEIAELTKQRDELLPLLMNGQASVNYHLSASFLSSLILYRDQYKFYDMKETIIQTVLDGMRAVLTENQLDLLTDVTRKALSECEITPKATEEEQRNKENVELLGAFISSKKVEGCSDKTIHYYKSSIEKLIATVKKNVCDIATNDIRCYLADQQEQRGLSKVTIDNLRRIYSSFFSWLEDEDYITKSPVRRIHKVRTDALVKEVLTDENIEVLRDSCHELRDIAMIDLLLSTGMRVGELVKINRDDIDFQERQCVVFGKGNKEREVYFNARTKIHLKKYLEQRTDTNPALFVSLHEPHTRLTISGVEVRLRQLGKRVNLNKVHPHKFRRTLATMAIDKGMPIEQVQKMLGHVKIDTTLHYAMVNQTNVKIAHRKFLN